MAIGPSAGVHGGQVRPTSGTRLSMPNLSSVFGGGGGNPGVSSVGVGATQGAARPGSPEYMAQIAANANGGGGGSSAGAAAGGGAGGAAGGGPVEAGGPVTNTAAADPNLSQFQDDVRARMRALQGKEGQDPLLLENVNDLRKRKSTDTRQRAQDFAAQDIGARARANSAALNESLARRGIRADTGVAAALQQQIRSESARAKARSAAGIGLEDEKRQDALTLGGAGIMAAPGGRELEREGMTNSMIGMEGQAAGALSQQGLGDRELELRQWQTSVDASQRAKEAAARQEEARLGQLLGFTRLGMEAQQYAR